MASVDNYEVQEWNDSPEYKNTPINAQRLSHIETGIKKNNTAIKEVCTELLTKAEDVQTFTQAISRQNINSGESIATVFGKIKKFFTDLKAVAFSGSYNDLSNKPTIPTVNNGTLTIQKNGTTIATFSANQSSGATANITVPTNTNQLTNGAGFITSSGSCAYATSAASAQSATYANSANSARSAESADYATRAGSADSAASATTAQNAVNATYASSAGTATSAMNATNASYAAACPESTKEFGMGSCKLKQSNTRLKWNNGSADYDVVTGDHDSGGGPHTYNLKWNGSRCELHIDGTYIGRIVTD